jgi:hypothetical protein
MIPRGHGLTKAWAVAARRKKRHRNLAMDIIFRSVWNMTNAVKYGKSSTFYAGLGEYRQNLFARFQPFPVVW